MHLRHRLGKRRVDIILALFVLHLVVFGVVFGISISSEAYASEMVSVNLVKHPNENLVGISDKYMTAEQFVSERINWDSSSKGGSLSTQSNGQRIEYRAKGGPMRAGDVVAWLRSPIQESVRNFSPSLDLRPWDLRVKIGYNSDGERKDAVSKAVDCLKNRVSDCYWPAFKPSENELTTSVHDLFCVDGAAPTINCSVDFVTESDGSKVVDVRAVSVVHQYRMPDQTYCDIATSRKYVNEYKKRLRSVVAMIPRTDPDVVKAKKLHDYLIKTCHYGTTQDEADKRDGKTDSYTTYSTLVTHDPVCYAFSLTYQAVLQELGMQVQVVSFHDENGGHSWNKVKINGRWYFVDVTWDDHADDPLETADTKYFLKGEDYWRKCSNGNDLHRDWNEKTPTVEKKSKYDNTAKWTQYWRDNIANPLFVKISRKASFEYNPSGAYRIVDSIMYRDGRRLIEGIHYKISAVAPTKCGTYKFTIIGIGSLSGTLTLKYKVVPRSISTVKVFHQNKIQYLHGLQLNPVKTVIFNNHYLVRGKDYQVTFKPRNAGTIGTCKVSGIGNYKGTRTFSCRVVPAPINTTLAISASPQTVFQPESQRGKPITVSISAKTYLPNAKQPKAGKDYIVKYSNNRYPGRATATVIGKGNYTGRASVGFYIVKSTLAGRTPGLMAGTPIWD